MLPPWDTLRCMAGGTGRSLGSLLAPEGPSHRIVKSCSPLFSSLNVPSPAHLYGGREQGSTRESTALSRGCWQQAVKLVACYSTREFHRLPPIDRSRFS
jgi:hypothetical protein